MSAESQLAAFQKRAEEAERLLSKLAARLDQLEGQVAKTHKSAAPIAAAPASASDSQGVEAFKATITNDLKELRTILEQEREERDQLKSDNEKLQYRVNILLRELKKADEAAGKK